MTVAKSPVHSFEGRLEHADFNDQAHSYVRDVARLKSFYETHFGFRVIEEIDDEWAVLLAGQVELALHLVGKPFRDLPLGPEQSNAKLVFTVDSGLSELRTKLESAEVPVGKMTSAIQASLILFATDVTRKETSFVFRAGLKVASPPYPLSIGVKSPLHSLIPVGGPPNLNECYGLIASVVAFQLAI